MIGSKFESRYQVVLHSPSSSCSLKTWDYGTKGKEARKHFNALRKAYKSYVNDTMMMLLDDLYISIVVKEWKDNRPYNFSTRDCIRLF